MPLIGRTHRLAHSFSSRKSAPRRQSKSSRVTKKKISHRFVRIHRKSKAYSRESSRRQKYAATGSEVDHDDRPKLILGYNRHLGEITAIPNPTPDTGLKPTATSSFSATTPPGRQTVHSVPLSKTGLPSPTFSTLPPLLSLDPNSSRSDPSYTAAPFTSAYEGPEPTMVSAAESQGPSQPHKLSIPIVVLLAVGSGVLLIGLFSLIKYYSRPRRRHLPTPSRPIMDDPFADFANDKRSPAVEDPDSPIFGGKERISGVNGAVWSWSQYPRPTISVTKPEENGPSETPSNGSGIIVHSPRLRGSLRGKVVSGHAHSYSVPISTSDSPYHASLQQVKEAMSRVANRISTASVSMYPSSPQSSFSNSNVGLAITRSPMTTYTADGSNVLKRTEPKAALDRTRNTLAASEATRGTISASSTMDRYSDGGDSELGSPSVLPYAAAPVNPPPTYGGRSRIKSSYYTPGLYPRVSDAQVLKDTGSANSNHKVLNSEKRDRDTQALTYALGLNSPATDYGGANTVPPSPQPTLYPEDSMSRRPSLRKAGPSVGAGVGGHGKKKSEGGGHPSLPVISHAMDASAALGSLMLLDFNGQATRVDNSTSNGNNASTSTSTSISAAAAAAGRNTGSISKSGKRVSQTVLSRPVEVGGGGGAGARVVRRNGTGRSDDKPPSIPLPELGLPSLTQMAMEHANPQAYGDYRSPTYSIFGLYGDRKSGIGG